MAWMISILFGERTNRYVTKKHAVQVIHQSVSSCYQYMNVDWLCQSCQGFYSRHYFQHCLAFP